MPDGTKVHVRHGNFLFSERGLWGLLAFISAAIYYSYYSAAAYAALTILLWTASRAWARSALNKLEIEEKLAAAEVFPCDSVALEIAVMNNKFFPVPWLELIRKKDKAPADNSPEQNETEGNPSEEKQTEENYRLGWLLGFQEKKIEFFISPKRRGVFTVGPQKARAGDPFAFFQTELNVNKPAQLVVYPHLLHPEWFDLSRRDPLGGRPDQNFLFQDPLFVSGVRDYQPFDSLRSVNWVASARFQTLKSNVWEGKAASRCYIFLEAQSLKECDWPEEKKELAWEILISSAATQATELTKRREEWGFLTDQKIYPLKSPGLLASGSNGSDIQLRQFLALLSSLEQGTGAWELTNLFAQLNLPLGITLVFYSAGYNKAMEEILRVLGMGRKIFWFVLAEEARHEGTIQPLALHPGWENDSDLAGLLLNNSVPYELDYT